MLYWSEIFRKRQRWSSGSCNDPNLKAHSKECFFLQFFAVCSLHQVFAGFFWYGRKNIDNWGLWLWLLAKSYLEGGAKRGTIVNWGAWLWLLAEGYLEGGAKRGMIVNWGARLWLLAEDYLEGCAKRGTIVNAPSVF